MNLPPTNLLLIVLLSLFVLASVAETSSTTATAGTSTASSTATASGAVSTTTTTSTTSTAPLATSVPSSSSTSSTSSNGLDRAFETECFAKVDVLGGCLAATWNDPSVFSIFEGLKRLGSRACNEACFAARQWVVETGNFTIDSAAGRKIPSRAAQCKDAIGIRGSSILAAAPIILDEACLGPPPNEQNVGCGMYCHLIFQHALFDKNVTVDKFVADPSVLSKDTACSPCMRALADYDKHVLESANRTNPVPVTTMLTETITRVLTGSVASTANPTATATTTLVATSTPIVWPQAKPAFPDMKAIQRMRDYCQWNTKQDQTKAGGASMAATAGTVGVLMAAVIATVTIVVVGLVPV